MTALITVLEAVPDGGYNIVTYVARRDGKPNKQRPIYAFRGFMRGVVDAITVCALFNRMEAGS